MARHGTARHGIIGAVSTQSVKEDAMSNNSGFDAILRVTPNQIKDEEAQSLIINFLDEPKHKDIFLHAARITLSVNPPMTDECFSNEVDHEALKTEGYAVKFSVTEGGIPTTGGPKVDLVELGNVTARLLENWTRGKKIAMNTYEFVGCGRSA
jgi:hypothetical protein